MQQFRYIFLVAVMVALAACQSNQEVEDRLVAAFGETMFNAGATAHGQGGLLSQSGNLAKWESPVTVAVVEGDTPENVAATMEILSELAGLSGLELEWAERGADGIKLEIHFSDKREFVINGNQLTTCYARTGDAPDGRLSSAGIYIGVTGEGEWRTSCLTHELLHALGWRGHTHRIRSAISYAHGESELTKWDRLMMRALYDPRLPPGISKADAIPIVRAIFHEIIEE
ncbi:MAG: DUF2927 domain-containing protein [Proteobacteria bacterium]|nr:DUF2927 domain-containing protein [Pseudomonadota bacterium]